MSTTFEVLYVPDISSADAALAEARVAAGLMAIGLIEGCKQERTDEMGRSIRRYPIAPQADALYRKRDPDGFGIGDYAESIVGRYANGWSLNSAEVYGCPSCGARFRRREEQAAFSQILNGMQDAIVAFIESGMENSLRCPACAAQRRAGLWFADIPPAFAHLAFEFSNVPPFTSSALTLPATSSDYGAWRVDVPRVFQDAVGRPIGWSMGRI